MTVSCLNSIEDFLKREVTPDISLLKANEDETRYELVHPSVFGGWIPDKGFLPEEMTSIPCLSVGMDEYDLNNDDGTLTVVITAAVSRYGTTDKEKQLTYGMNGYIDLLNLLDKTAAALLRTKYPAPNLKRTTGVKISMYKEQPYPYWYGKLKFTVDTAGYPCTYSSSKL